MDSRQRWKKSVSRLVPVCTIPWRGSYRRRNPGRYRGCRDRPAWSRSTGCLRLTRSVPPHSASLLCCYCCHLLAETHHRMSHCCPAEGPVWIFSQGSAGRCPGSSQTCRALDPHGWRSDGRASRLRAARRERKARRSGSNRLCSWLWSGKFINEMFSESFSVSSTPSVLKVRTTGGIRIVILDDVNISVLGIWRRALDEWENVLEIRIHSHHIFVHTYNKGPSIPSFHQTFKIIRDGTGLNKKQLFCLIFKLELSQRFSRFKNTNVWLNII